MTLPVYVLAAFAAITQSPSNDREASIENSAGDQPSISSGGVKRPSPVPKGNPGQWANTNDYPPVALQKQMEGTTGFRLTVGPDGRVTECQIASSSGSSELDQATCANVLRRARFDPALDAQGKPISGTYSNRVRWQIPNFVQMESYPKAPSLINRSWARLLPEDFPPAALNEKREGTVKVELSISPDGGVSGCKVVKSSGHIDLDEASCQIAFARAKFGAALDVDGQPTAGRVLADLNWQHTPKPGAAIPKPPVTLDFVPKAGVTEVTFVVTKEGDFTECKTEPTGSATFGAAICKLKWKQKPYLDVNGQPVGRRVKIKTVVETVDLQP